MSKTNRKPFPYHKNTEFKVNEEIFSPLYITAFKDSYDHMIILDFYNLKKDQKGHISSESKTKFSHQSLPINPN